MRQSKQLVLRHGRTSPQQHEHERAEHVVIHHDPFFLSPSMPRESARNTNWTTRSSRLIAMSTYMFRYRHTTNLLKAFSAATL